MEPGAERPPALATRWSGRRTPSALAAIHAEAWRYAYAGVIPEPGLARMISRRGPGLVAAAPRRRRQGARCIGLRRAPVGYALLGRCRGGPGGEIQELYVRPDCQGLGFGARLFEAARGRARARRGVAPLTVWCLEDNRLGLGFYRALGGRETGRALDRIGGAQLGKLRFTWS